MVLALVAAAILLLLGGAVDVLAPIGVLSLLVVVMIALAEVVRTPKLDALRIERRMPAKLSLNEAETVAYELTNLTDRPLRVELAEQWPESLTPGDRRLEAILSGRAGGQVATRVTGSRRGRFVLDRLDVRLASPLGFWSRQQGLDRADEIRVYPNLRNLKKFELKIRRNMEFAQGLGRQRRLGQGDEFETLRPYEQGDPMSRVDWKATARRMDLIVRNYQPEQRQHVLIAIDTGRATAGRFENVSRLDSLVNAALMLSYVVLRQGDWLSVMAFSDRIERYVAPMRGLGRVNEVARQLHELESRREESDYAQACRYLSLRHRKRSLLCILTDVLDTQASGVLLSYVARFARRHLPLVVTLADPELRKLAVEPLDACRELHAKAVAIDLLKARGEALVAMRQSGVDVLDVGPGQLVTSLVDRYLKIKSRHRL
jgi:uncharacterized protein (DUF58 family)